MALTPPPSAPPAAPPLPGEAPSRANPSAFRALADAFVVWQVGFRDWLAGMVTWLAGYVAWASTNVAEMGALQTDVAAKQIAAAGSATAAAGSAAAAAISAATASSARDETVAAVPPIQVADYAALRAYAGLATTLYVTGHLGTTQPSGLAGTFLRDDADTTTADDGGAVIVAANGKRWKRAFTGPVRVAWYGAVPGIDCTAAFASAIALAAVRGIGEVCFSGVLLASQIVLKRFVVVCGDGSGAAELKQIGGSNRDFVVSENFAALTGGGLTIADARVPSWFGVGDLRINGNKFDAVTNPTGNTSGRGVAWYGPSQIMRGTVMVYGCSEHGIYTEDSNAAANTTWQGQEEGQFGHVIVRDNGAIGWLSLGPHNSRCESLTAGFNGSWGFKNESSATYSGGFDWIGSLHTYANGRSVTPAADTGASFGVICRIGALITDGDNPTIDADRVQIQTYRCFNLGGERDGLIVNGKSCFIGSVNGNVWPSSVGRTAIKVLGDDNRIGAVRLSGSATDNDGILITGAHCQVEGLDLDGFSAPGRKALDLQGSKCRIRGEISDSAIAFNYVAGTNNNVDLELQTNAGQVAVAGSSPGTTDRFNLRSSGAVAGGTRSAQQSAQVPMDTTAPQSITLAHGMLYTPAREKCRVNLIDSSPTSTAYVMAYLRVASSDATNVTVQFKLATAAAAGTLARIALEVSI